MDILSKYFDALAAPNSKGKVKEKAKSKPVITLLLLLLAAGATYIPGAFELTLFDHSAIRQGEWWRLVTGHFTHTGSSHLMWDLLAAALATGYLEIHSRRLAIAAVVCGIFAVDILLLSSLSSLKFYCGLSGLLFAPLTLTVIIFGLKNGGLSGWLPALICAGKALWELIGSDSFLVNSGWPAYPMAHLAGICGGLFVLLTTILYRSSAYISEMIRFEIAISVRHTSAHGRPLNL
ncbi:MAG: rhombosortase [Amphritea sp.]